jgi:hypothetical protein
VEDHHRAGHAGEVLLAGEVVVAGDVVHVHPAQVAAGHEPGAALAGRHVVREPEQLDVERRALVDDRVAVQALRVQVARGLDVHEVVVDDRVRRRRATGSRRRPTGSRTIAPNGESGG